MMTATRSDGKTPAYRIMIVDDDNDDIYIMQHALKSLYDRNDRAGCICIANNGVEGLDALDQARGRGVMPDLMLLDLNMPVMGGLAMLQRCREMKQYRDLPIVIITTASDETMEAEALALGASAVHTKPTARSEMMALIETITKTWCHKLKH